MREVVSLYLTRPKLDLVAPAMPKDSHAFLGWTILTSDFRLPSLDESESVSQSFFGGEQSEKTKWAAVMSEFSPIFIYLVISPLVSLILLGLPFPFSSNSSTYPEKLSAYECGFDPSGDARSRFDIRFYLVSILFIILDPEVTFSFPWAVPPNKIDPFGFWSMMAFLFILTIGFLYEWKRGASDRE